MNHARALCTIAGIPTPVIEIETQHGVDQPIGTATLTVEAPVAAWITLNAVVVVQEGYTETGLQTRFSGRVVTIRRGFSDDGKTAQVDCSGWASLLAFPDQSDLVYYNSSSLYGIFRSLCKRRGVPAYHADYVRDPSGATDIRLGGNELVDGGNVIIPRLTSPLDWLTTKAALYGYRVFDTPAGVVTMQRISGIPPSADAPTVEAIDIIQADRTDDLAAMNTYVEVTGAQYTDADGVNVKIRSIPAAVPYSALLDPPGYRYRQISDDSIVTTQLAGWVRNVHEIDEGTPSITATYQIAADPTLRPGLPVRVVSGTLGLAANRWLMSLSETFADDGYWATADGWSGGGTALPAGNDAITITVGTGPYHAGDEYVAWYAVPNPQGRVYRIPFTVPDVYTAIVLTYRCHGANSYLLDGANSDSTVSQVQVWQGGKQVGSAQLPVLNEDYTLQRDYTNLANWTQVRSPVPGQLVSGAAEIRIVSGQDSRLPDSTRVDDFEIRDIVLTLTGAGNPTLPGEQT